MVFHWHGESRYWYLASQVQQKFCLTRKATSIPSFSSQSRLIFFFLFSTKLWKGGIELPFAARLSAHLSIRLPTFDLDLFDLVYFRRKLITHAVQPKPSSRRGTPRAMHIQFFLPVCHVIILSPPTPVQIRVTIHSLKMFSSHVQDSSN